MVLRVSALRIAIFFIGKLLGFIINQAKLWEWARAAAATSIEGGGGFEGFGFANSDLFHKVLLINPYHYGLWLNHSSAICRTICSGR